MNQDRPVCIVTAASQGIGEAIARELAARDYRLALMSRSDRSIRLAKELGGIGIRGSVTSQADIDNLVRSTVKHYGQLDAVVNNTGRHSEVLEKYGIEADRPTVATLNFDPDYAPDILAIPDAAWLDDFDLMVLNTVRMARAATPHLQQRPASAIVNISGMESVQPRVVYPLAPVRLALHGFTKVYADRYGRDGIRMNCVLPGVISNVVMDETLIGKAIPLRRYGTLAEVAKTVAFLLSPDAAYITGQLLLVDGGLNRGL